MVRTLPTEPVSPYKLAHAVLRTAHMDETIRHYQLLLNARIVADQRPFAAAVSYDEEHHRLAFVAVPAQADDGAGESVRYDDDAGAVGVDFAVAPGLEHLAFVFESLDALLGTYVRAKAAGIEPVLCINHGLTVSIYYADPDGVKSELMIEAVAMHLANEYMLSPEIAANPFGWPFDPDELVARFEAGEPLAELMVIGRDQYLQNLTPAS